MVLPSNNHIGLAVHIQPSQLEYLTFQISSGVQFPIMKAEPVKLAKFPKTCKERQSPVV